MCLKRRRKDLLSWLLEGRQSKRVRLIPPTQVVNAASSRILTVLRQNRHQLQKIGTGHMHMMAAWTKMRPRAIPSPKMIPYPKVGSYVTLKTVALMFVYLFNNVNLNCSTYTKRWPEEGEGSNQVSYA